MLGRPSTAEEREAALQPGPLHGKLGLRSLQDSELDKIGGCPTLPPRTSGREDAWKGDDTAYLNGVVANTKYGTTKCIETYPTTCELVGFEVNKTMNDRLSYKL